MKKTGTCLAAFVAVLALGGCTKEDVRLFKLYTFQLDPEPKKPARRKMATVTPSNDNDAEKAAVAAAAANPGVAAIETGGTPSDACQGEHIAYQATKEYLKNFGPRPPDEPGELGPCKAGAPAPREKPAQ